MAVVLPFARLALVVVLGAQLSQSAETTTNEFWPEANLHVALNRSVRVIVSTKKERDVAFRNEETGIDVEWSLRQFRGFLLGRLFEQDSTRAKRFTMRVGYRYKRSIGTPAPVNENRPLIEFTNRWVLPADILMSNRGRVEFRFVGGTFSWRYRDQIKLEKDFQIRHYAITGHVGGEAFYDSGPGTWDRFRFTGGMVFPIGIRFAIEPYYTRQIATRSEPRNLNVLGLALQVHFPK